MQMTDQGVAQEAPAREGSSGRQEGTGQEGRRGWAQRGGSGALVDPALGAGITSWHSGEVLHQSRTALQVRAFTSHWPWAPQAGERIPGLGRARRWL